LPTRDPDTWKNRGPRHESIEKSRLADAHLAIDKHHLSAPAPRTLKMLQKLLQLTRATDKGGRL
jgi:hypothetical protein